MNNKERSRLRTLFKRIAWLQSRVGKKQAEAPGFCLSFDLQEIGTLKWVLRELQYLGSREEWASLGLEFPTVDLEVDPTFP
jgi:hypothetical protein